jgi:hypothetical protein
MERSDQMGLSLTVDEIDALRLLLDEALGDLSFEIADTENPDYRTHLRDPRKPLRRIRHVIV